MKSVFNFLIKHKVYLLLLLSALISTPGSLNSVHANTNVYREESIVKVDAGKDHAGLLTSEGRLFLWGANGQGQLGNGNTPINSFRSKSPL
jgi:alpha-tubulin suppressor-like RCC1 family protein